jgi:hypothetical protein
MPARLPADCLLTRIRGRRSFLIRDWERLLIARQSLETLASAPWRNGADLGQVAARRALQQEYFWAFSRMDEQMRHKTALFFWLGEVRTLAVCLRLLSGGVKNLSVPLHFSLLSNAIKEQVQKADDVAAALSGLTEILAGHDARFAGVDKAWHTGGYGALEAAIHDRSLMSAARTSLHPVMRSYLELMIDSRNLTAVAKHLRWRLNTLPALMAGGTLSLSRLTGLFERRDSAGLLHLAMRLGGEAPYSETADPERVLFEAQARVMGRLARKEDGVGAVIDYLWRCGNEAANIGLLECLETAGSDHVATELRR